MSLPLWRAAFALSLAGQCIALYWPRTPSIGSGLPLDKVVHVALFAGVAALGTRAGLRMRWLVLLLSLQAVVSEVVQGWLLPGRGTEAADLLADAVGIAAGLLIGRWWLGRVGSVGGGLAAEAGKAPSGEGHR